LRNTISFCASKKIWAARRDIWAEKRFIKSGKRAFDNRPRQNGFRKTSTVYKLKQEIFMILQNEKFGSRTRRFCLNVAVAFSLLIILSGIAVAQSKNTSNLTVATSKSSANLPDLKVRQFLFVPSDDKRVRVQISNGGKKASAACRLELTVRKINGAAVGRTLHVTIPAIQPGQGDWLNVDASGILPKNVSLKDTTFKLIADSTKIVVESNEANNEVWHNLN
jgi:hypothetical protein